MKIKVSTESERFKLALTDEAGIVYRRVPTFLQNQWVRAATKRGETDWTQVLEKSIRYAALDWYGFIDDAGAEVPFNVELLLKMPGDIISKISEAAGLSQGEEGK